MCENWKLRCEHRSIIWDFGEWLLWQCGKNRQSVLDLLFWTKIWYCTSWKDSRESRLWGLWIGSCDCIRSEDRMWTLAGQPQKAPPCHPCMYTYVQYLAHWVQFASWWHCRFYSALQCRRTLAIAGQRQKVSTPLLPPHIIQDVNMYKLYAYMMSARKGKFSWEEVMCASITWEHSVRRSDSTSMQLHTLLLMNFHLLFLNAIFKSNGNQHKLYMRTVLDDQIEHLSTGALFFHRLFLNVMFQEHWKSAQF